MRERPTPTTTKRRLMPAGRALIVIVIALLVWTILYAPELQRTADAAPVGTRRTIALNLLAPLVWVSNRIGLTAATDAAARAAGRDPAGAVGDIDVGVDQLPSPTATKPNPTKQPVRDTDIREPTPHRQLRIVVVGDSLAQGIGYSADRVFKPFWTEVFKQGRISTGLARPDYFDWNAQMQTIVDRADPDLVIVMLGENDNQGLLYPNGDLEQDIGTFEWAAHYQARVQTFAAIASSGGAHVIWVGLPNERDHGRWDFIERQNGIYESVADELPNVAYFDTWDTFDAPDGDYSAYYRSGGTVTLVRAQDGVHFNSDGYTMLMEQVARFATREFELEPKTYGR